MTDVDLGLKQILDGKKENEETTSKDVNDKTISTEKNENKIKNIEIENASFFDLYINKKYEEIKFLAEKNLLEKDEDNKEWILSKIWQLIVNIEQKEIPSVILVAPFGEICEKIKSFSKKEKEEDIGRQIIEAGSMLYIKFLDSLSTSNEEYLKNMLSQYAPLFNIKINNKDEFKESVLSKREQDFVEEITFVKQFDKKRRNILLTLISIVLILGGIIITLNHVLNLKKEAQPDAISFDNVNVKYPYIKEDSLGIEPSLSINDKKKQDYNFEETSKLMNSLFEKEFQKAKDNVRKKKAKKIFKPGIYEIVNDTKAKMNPEDDAREIGTLKKFDRIKVVGKKENYLQIVSKDGSVNGYVNKKDAKFIKENENQ